MSLFGLSDNSIGASEQNAMVLDTSGNYDIEEPGVKNLNETDLFANALKESRSADNTDPLAIIKSYISIATDVYMNDDSRDQDEKGELKLEIQFWHLVNRIYAFRASDITHIGDIPSYASNILVIEKYLLENPRAKEHHIILEWIKEAFTKPSPPDDLQGQKWMYTKNAIRQQGTYGSFSNFKVAVPVPSVNNSDASAESNNIVSRLDVDAPIREHKSIHNKDKEFDTLLFRYVFQLLRAGSYDEAFEVCKQTGNWQLRMAIAGVHEYFDDDIDGKLLNLNPLEGVKGSSHGIKNRALWRRLCQQLAQNQSLNSYERGIYGILSGDLESVLALSDSWESQLFSYMSAIVASEDEHALQLAGRLDHATLESFDSNFVSPTTTNASSAIEALAHSHMSVVKLQSEDNYRILMGAVINKTTEELFTTLTEIFKQYQDEDDDDDNEDDSKLLALLRVVTHYAIFLKTIGIPSGSDELLAELIRVYTIYLGVEKKDYEVPLYVSYLNSDLAIDVYSQLLCSINDSKQRREHIALGAQYGIDMENTIRLTVAKIFNSTENEYLALESSMPSEFSTNVGVADSERISSIEWFQLSSLWADALHSSVFALRDFFLSGKVEAARQCGSEIVITAIIQTYEANKLSDHDTSGLSGGLVQDTELAELSEYSRLVACLDLFQLWYDHYDKYNGDAPSGNWATKANAIISSISDTVYELSYTWMSKVEYPIETKESQVVEQLRTMYIPFLILSLLDILIKAQLIHPMYLKKAAELAILVADENSRHYLCFVRGGYLEVFIKKVSIAVTDGLAKGEEGIYRKSG